jgi:Tn3 transposase DDE domain/Domain of unknown function (DUF4158)
MTILTILSPEEIQLFEQPPQFTTDERKSYFHLPKGAEEIIETLQTPASKVGFLLLLGYFRATKKFYAPDTFSQADIVFAKRRLSLETSGELAQFVKTTMHRHARYVIDGMMHNAVVKSDMHAVDTHGVTPLTFAAMHFLGIFFAPRIAGLDKRRLYSFIKRKAYQKNGYRLLPDNIISADIIREHRGDILRFMATIILKETPASQLFERLNSYSHQHPLYIRNLDRSLRPCISSATSMNLRSVRPSRRNSINASIPSGLPRQSFMTITMNSDRRRERSS